MFLVLPPPPRLRPPPPGARVFLSFPFGVRFRGPPTPLGCPAPAFGKKDSLKEGVCFLVGPWGVLSLVGNRWDQAARSECREVFVRLVGGSMASRLQLFLSAFLHLPPRTCLLYHGTVVRKMPKGPPLELEAAPIIAESDALS